MADRPGPNDTLPHGTEARLRDHLAHGQVPCHGCARVLDLLDLEGIWAPGVVEPPSKEGV